jgi:hypothetical protein
MYGPAQGLKQSHAGGGFFPGSTGYTDCGLKPGTDEADVLDEKAVSSR